MTLIPTGPLTNIALLLKCYPDLMPKIEKIFMMGGTCKFIGKENDSISSNF